MAAGLSVTSSLSITGIEARRSERIEAGHTGRAMPGALHETPNERQPFPTACQRRRSN